MTVALADLLTVPTEDNLRQQFLSDLNANGFPITDFESGAALKTYVFLQARAYLIALGKVIPKIAAGGYLAEAQDVWLTLLALQEFNVPRQAATFTVQRATLACNAANGPFTINAGDLIAQTSLGHRYTNITGGTLPTSGTLELQWQSEGPQDSTNPEANYIDAAGTMTTLLTPKPGVTINNPLVDFSPVMLGSASTSFVTAARTNSLVTPSAGTILIKITTQGQVGVAAFSYRRIGIDTDFVAAGLTAATFDIPTIGVRVGFVNGPGTLTFLVGQIFSFSTPGGPTIVQGRDVETDAALVARCMDRFPDLSMIATDGKYRRWAFAASSQVTKVGIATSTLAPSTVNITIAGQANPIGGDVIATVQAYIDARTQGTEFGIVSAAVAANIVIGGAVTVPIGTTAAVQAAADIDWTAYINGIPLGGSPGATVRLQELQQILGDAGATDVSGLAITSSNGTNIGALPTLAPPNVNVLLNAGTAASIQGAANLPSQALTWSEA